MCGYIMHTCKTSMLVPYLITRESKSILGKPLLAAIFSTWLTTFITGQRSKLSIHVPSKKMADVIHFGVLL